MRNLKKVLSLALVLVMVLALSAGAAYSDQDQIGDTYEADVNLLSAIKVMQGTNGQFKPQALVTRAEMAKMIYVAKNGVDDLAELYASQPLKFTDMAGANWAENYVKWASIKGIISGTNAEGTTFKPLANVTGVQAAKMILTMAGFDAKIEGYQDNENWAFNIADDAKTYGLLKDLPYSCMSRELTREEAAKMIANGLRGGVVSYSSWTLPSGETVLGKAVVSETKTNLKDVFELEQKTATVLKTAAFGLGGISAKTADNKETVTVKIGEGTETLTGSADASMVGQEVTVYYNEDKVLYGMSATGKTVTAVVTNGVKMADDAAKKIDVDLAESYLDGKKDASAVDTNVKAGYTAIYYGTKDAATGVTKYTMLSVISEEIAKVTKYDTVKGKITAGAISNLDIKDVTGADSVKLNDYVLITKTFTSGTSYTYAVEKASAIEGKITQIRGGKYTINGTAYAASGITGADASYAVNNEGTFYLDSCGNIAKLVGGNTAPLTTYAMIYEAQAYSAGSALTAGNTASVYAMLQDGTLGAYEIAAVGTTVGNDKITDEVLTTAGLKTATKAAPAFTTYTLTDDGKIKLGATAIAITGTYTLDADYTKGASVIKLNSQSLLVTADTVVFVKGAGTTYANAYTAYIGKGNVPSIADAEDATKVLAYEAADTASGKALKYLVVAPANAATTKAYAVVTDIVEKANAANATKTFYTLFDGKTTTEYEASAAVSTVAVGDVVSFTVTGGIVTVAEDATVVATDKVFATAYSANEFISTANGGADIDTAEGKAAITTTMINKDKVVLMTVTKDAEGNLTGAAGVDGLVSDRDTIYGGESGKGNVTVVTAGGQAVVIILWK